MTKRRMIEGKDPGIEHENGRWRAALAGVLVALGVGGLAVPQARALPVCDAMSGISACCKITSSGVYHFNGNINGSISSGDCISVQAANVVLLANDHNLANAMLAGVGIHVHSGASRFSMSAGSTFSGTDGEVKGFLVGIQNDGSNVLVADVDCEGNGTGIINNGPRASYFFLDASTSSGNGFVNNSAAGLKLASLAADANGGNGLVLINTSGALFADFSEADGNGSTGVKVSGGGGNTMVTIDASGNGADGIWLKHSVGNTVIDFTANGNLKTGIYIGCSATGNPDGTSCGVSPSRGNSLQAGVGFQTVPPTTTADSNTVAGIGIDSGNGGNQVFGIEASLNGTDDAIDKNANCGSNFWTMNTFAKPNPACTKGQ
jgi:parallel beta-helix repeat protein